MQHSVSFNWKEKRPPVKFKWRGNHHLYYGIFFAAFGIFNWFMGIDNAELSGIIPFWQLLVGIGIGIIVDDTIEHLVTADTPLRIFYEKIIRPLLFK
jgi:hypothetical protein